MSTFFSEAVLAITDILVANDISAPSINTNVVRAAGNRAQLTFSSSGISTLPLTHNWGTSDYTTLYLFG